MAWFRPVPLSWKKILLTAIEAFLFGSVMVYFIFQEKGQDIIPNIFLNASLFFFMSLGYGYIADSITISWVKEPLKRFVVEIVATAIYIASMAVICFLSMAIIFYGITLFEAFGWINARYFFIVFGISYFLGFIFTSTKFLKNWKAAELQTAQLKEAQSAAHYESLKNQVNPHFLFNSLNVLTTLVYKDQDLAAKYIKQLSNTYRYVLENNNKELVTLKEELEALSSYTFLMKMRFGKGFKVNITIPTVEKYKIAPLTLQMLLENAIKHNIAHERQVLQIDIKEEQGYLWIKNNIQLKSHQIESTGIGLENIKSRYQYLIEKEVQILEDENYFTVAIPLIEQKEMAMLSDV